MKEDKHLASPAPRPFSSWLCSRRKGGRRLFVVSSAGVSTLPLPSLRSGYNSWTRVLGLSTLGPLGLLPRAPRLDCGNCTRLQVVEQLMGRDQGPAVTKGNLFFSLFLTVVAPARCRRLRPRGRRPRGRRIHAHSASHLHTRPHTHSSSRDVGREGDLTAGGRWGLARVRGFCSHWAVWLLRETKGRVAGEHSQSSTLGGIGTVSTPGISPPVSPQCHSPGGSPRQTRGRLLSAGREPVPLEAGEGWRTDRDRVRSSAQG